LDTPWIEGTVTVEQGQRPIQRPWGMDRPSCLALSADASLAALGYPNGEVKVWDLKTNRRLKARDWQRGAISAVAFAGNGELALAAGNQVILWNWDSNERSVISQASEEAVVALKADPSGARLAVASATGRTWVLSVRTGLRLSCEWSGVQDTVALGWSQDGDGVFSMSRHGRLCHLKVPKRLHLPLTEVETYLGLGLDEQGNPIRLRD